MKNYQMVAILELIIFINFISKGILLLSEAFEKIMKMIFL